MMEAARHCRAKGLRRRYQKTMEDKRKAKGETRMGLEGDERVRWFIQNSTLDLLY